MINAIVFTGEDSLKIGIDGHFSVTELIFPNSTSFYLETAGKKHNTIKRKLTKATLVFLTPLEPIRQPRAE